MVPLTYQKPIVGSRRSNQKVKLESKPSEEKSEDLASKTKLIFKQKKPNPFYISNMPEKELIQDLATWSTLKIWGGPVLSIGCVAYLFATFFP